MSFQDNNEEIKISDLYHRHRGIKTPKLSYEDLTDKPALNNQYVLSPGQAQYHLGMASYQCAADVDTYVVYDSFYLPSGYHISSIKWAWAIQGGSGNNVVWGMQIIANTDAQAESYKNETNSETKSTVATTTVYFYTASPTWYDAIGNGYAGQGDIITIRLIRYGTDVNDTEAGDLIFGPIIVKIAK